MCKIAIISIVNMGYTGQAIKGISWLGGFRIFVRSLSFLRIIIIARVLSPSQFGVYGIATLVLALIEILTETGINVVLIQRKDDIKSYVNTAWIVSIIRGFLIFLVIIVSSSFISNFFRSTDVFPLLILISLVPLIRGFINPSIVRFQKELAFQKEFYYRSSIFLIETIVSILLVIITKQPIALIYGLLMGAVFEVFISFAFVSPRPKLDFNKKIFQDIISRGKWITSGGILAYLFQNTDNIIVGKMLGTGQLGIYDMAYSISLLPISEISDIVARVTFPVYVKIGGDLERLRRAFTKTCIITIILVTPPLLLFLLFPKELILLFLGSNWIGGENVLRVLSVFAFINIISSPAGAIFFATNKQKYLTFLTSISLIIMLISIVPLVNMFGLIGAAIAVVIGSAVAFPLQVFLIIKTLSDPQKSSI